MPMAFYPKTDRQRLSDLWAYAETTARTASLPSGFVSIYDPGMAFDSPDLTGDPDAPALFATWGFRVDAIDAFSDVAPTRLLSVSARIFCQRAAHFGSTVGYLEDAVSELWDALQGDNLVTGLDRVRPQSLAWEILPLFDPDWVEGRMDFDLLSKG